MEYIGVKEMTFYLKSTMILAHENILPKF